MLTLLAVDVKKRLPFHKKIQPSTELSPEEELSI